MTVRSLKLLRDWTAAGKTTFFHCTVGEDRTGYLAGLYRLLTETTTAKAMFEQEMCERGYSSGNPQKPYVGLQNYRELKSDPYFKQALKNTAYFTLGTVPLSVAFGLGIALLLNRPIRGRAVFRTFYYLPVVTPLVVSGLIWKWVLDGDFGVLNYYIGKIGISPQLWLSNPSLAMPSVIAMSVWATVGFTMLVYLAGLQAIPEEYYEASSVDGAGAWYQFRYITLPLLAPSTFFLAVYLIISTFQVFDQIFVMTNGGPLRATTTVVYYIWQAGFQDFTMGYASAMAYALFAIIFVFTVILVVMQNRRSDY
jgi:multiple sugar transport system permease protein